jgi:hypothetical protein
MDWIDRYRMPHRRRLEGLLSLVVVLLVLRLILDVPQLVVAAAAVAFLGLASVVVSTLLSAAWWGLTGLIGRVVSGTLLTLVWLLVVTPMGFARRLLGKGPPSLRQLPKGGIPSLEVRDHPFGPADFEKPW